MIQLSSKEINKTTETQLASFQKEIDGEDTFEAKIEKAKAKWKNKDSTNDAKNAFKNVKNVLTEMCSGDRICVYCEHNEATDIEHIYPKRLYPEKTFSWANYVYACGKCNSHYKAENFSIFNPIDSITVQDVTPKRNDYSKPINDDALFINQRIENPMDFLELDIVYGQYIFREIFTKGTREYEKAKYTKILLGLNDRADLVKQREAAHLWYLSKLKKYVLVKRSENFIQLQEADYGKNVIENIGFEIEKHKILNVLKAEILSHSHQTVWKELIRQRKDLPKTNSLLSEAPEILNW